jgi:hypothetical protein
MIRSRLCFVFLLGLLVSSLVVTVKVYKEVSACRGIFFIGIGLTTVEVSIEVGHIGEWMMVMVAEREQWRPSVTQLGLVTARGHPRSGHPEKFSVPSPPVPVSA